MSITERITVSVNDAVDVIARAFSQGLPVHCGEDVYYRITRAQLYTRMLNHMTICSDSWHGEFTFAVPSVEGMPQSSSPVMREYRIADGSRLDVQALQIFLDRFCEAAEAVVAEMDRRISSSRNPKTAVPSPLIKAAMDLYDQIDMFFEGSIRVIDTNQDDEDQMPVDGRLIDLMELRGGPRAESDSTLTFRPVKRPTQPSTPSMCPQDSRDEEGRTPIAVGEESSKKPSLRFATVAGWLSEVARIDHMFVVSLWPSNWKHPLARRDAATCTILGELFITIGYYIGSTSTPLTVEVANRERHRREKILIVSSHGKRITTSALNSLDEEHIYNLLRGITLRNNGIPSSSTLSTWFSEEDETLLRQRYETFMATSYSFQKPLPDWIVRNATEFVNRVLVKEMAPKNRPRFAVSSLRINPEFVYVLTVTDWMVSTISSDAERVFTLWLSTSGRSPGYDDVVLLSGGDDLFSAIGYYVGSTNIPMAVDTPNGVDSQRKNCLIPDSRKSLPAEFSLDRLKVYHLDSLVMGIAKSEGGFPENPFLKEWFSEKDLELLHCRYDALEESKKAELEPLRAEDTDEDVIYELLGSTLIRIRRIVTLR